MKCPECGTKFKKKRPWQKCCKDLCAQAQRNKRRAKRIKKALAMADDHRAQMMGGLGTGD